MAMCKCLTMEGEVVACVGPDRKVHYCDKCAYRIHCESYRLCDVLPKVPIEKEKETGSA